MLFRRIYPLLIFLQDKLSITYDVDLKSMQFRN